MSTSLRATQPDDRKKGGGRPGLVTEVPAMVKAGVLPSWQRAAPAMIWSWPSFFCLFYNPQLKLCECYPFPLKGFPFHV